MGIACSSGGGGSSPAVSPTVLTITPTNGEAIESDGAGLLNENTDGSPTPFPLGTISDNKNDNGEAVYKIATGDDATADNVNFNIEDNTLYYIDADAGDFEAAGVKKSFTLKIERYNGCTYRNLEIACTFSRV